MFENDSCTASTANPPSERFWEGRRSHLDKASADSNPRSVFKNVKWQNGVKCPRFSRGGGRRLQLHRQQTRAKLGRHRRLETIGLKRLYRLKKNTQKF